MGTWYPAEIPGALPQSLAVFEGYFLEEDPVGPALDAAPPSPVPLDTVQAEVKYNHNAVLARLKTRYDVWYAPFPPLLSTLPLPSAI